MISSLEEIKKQEQPKKEGRLGYDGKERKFKLLKYHGD
jgi:hypothetical protein